MVARFSLPFDQLAALLVERGAVVAGGAMVAAYMPGQPAEAFSGDFDIFIRQVPAAAGRLRGGWFFHLLLPQRHLSTCAAAASCLHARSPPSTSGRR